MEFISGYIMKLLAVSLICGAAVQLLGSKGSMGPLIRLIAGLFMTVTVISPWAQVRIQHMSDYFEDVSSGSGQIVVAGEEQAREMLVSIIKERTQAYILDKANSYGAELAVEVSVDGSDTPVPCAVQISGSISPAGKKALSNMIRQELGIPLEEQTWIG